MRSPPEGIFDPELFDKISNSTKRIPSESKREAWVTDTILLLVSQLDEKAVLSGGSAVRNITRVLRTTYDVDFDTPINSLKQLRELLKKTNQNLGIRHNRSALGAFYENPNRNIAKTFYGESKILHMLRKTEHGLLKIHIMYVIDMPEMFQKPPRLELITIEETNYKVPNAQASALFYRKSLRANKEKRVEDFLDLYHIIRSLNAVKRAALIAYLKSKDVKAVVKGLNVLSSDPENYIASLKDRLAYVESDTSVPNMKSKAYTISQELQTVVKEITSA